MLRFFNANHSLFKSHSKKEVFAKSNEDTASPNADVESNATLQSADSLLNAETCASSRKVNLENLEDEGSDECLIECHQYVESASVSKTNTSSLTEGVVPVSRKDDNTRLQKRVKNLPTQDEVNIDRSANTRRSKYLSFYRRPFVGSFDSRTSSKEPTETPPTNDKHVESIDELVTVQPPDQASLSAKKPLKGLSPFGKGVALINNILMAKGRHRYPLRGRSAKFSNKVSPKEAEKKTKLKDITPRFLSRSRRSKNTNQETQPDGAAQVTSTAGESAEAGAKNNSTDAPSVHAIQRNEETAETPTDAKNGESTGSHQAVVENASTRQRHHEKTSDQEKLGRSFLRGARSKNKLKSSQTTECDSGRLKVNNKKEMGQTQAKNDLYTSYPQPVLRCRAFRESLFDEYADDEVPQLEVPKIVVEDYGNDVDQSNVATEQKANHLLNVPDETSANETARENVGEDQWQFVNTPHETAPETSATVHQSNIITPNSEIPENADAVGNVLHINSCDLVSDKCKVESNQTSHEACSLDPNEITSNGGDFDYCQDIPVTVFEGVDEVTEDADNASAILIESISLPDVVVESTTAQNGYVVVKNGSGDCVHSDHVGNISGSNSTEDVDESSTVKMGNVHFIPIRVEKRQSIDDSVLMSKSANSGHSVYNGEQYNESRTTVEITAEEEESNPNPDLPISQTTEKKDLVDNELDFSTELSEAQQSIHNLQTKANELQAKVDFLERDVSLKSWNVEQLQAELDAAHKEDECVRAKLKLLEEEKTVLRQRFFDTEEELNSKYGDLERRYKELDETYKDTKTLVESLHNQLAATQYDVERLRQDTLALRKEKEEQTVQLEEALTKAKNEKEEMDTRWRQQFEILRTQNADREEQLMKDCEWQLRHMQKTCKEKFEKAENDRKDVVAINETLEEGIKERDKQIKELRSTEIELRQLRGVMADQENSITAMSNQIETLKAELVAAKENVAEQIECVRKMKYQCDNAIYDKEREVLQRIDEVRNEAAVRWENKLMTEMTRLKSELESVYVEERREELNKLQAEHVEELKALTSRYTANEEELRTEITELKDTLELRNTEFMELREKSDNAILQTRMHLDRADRDYQAAMCREEEKREQLTEKLRKEFDNEKLEMEERFRERLGQVKDEFNKELQISTQDILKKQQKLLEQQYQKLMADKEEAIQEIESRYRKKFEDAEQRLRDTETRHQHDLADLKIMYDTEKSSLDKRDISNAQEIEQLHRKCRCLTNLFEEMRMRYERRDPRPEDLREIAELRSRCEAQERDLFELTDRLREMQISVEELQGNKSSIRKPPPKTIPTNCDVIYEENEERESPSGSPSPQVPPTSPQSQISKTNGPVNEPDESSGEEIEEEGDDDQQDDDEEDDDGKNTNSIAIHETIINNPIFISNDTQKEFKNAIDSASGSTKYAIKNQQGC